MPSQTTFSGHILLLSGPAWGHIRALSVLACKVAKERPDIALTFLTVGEYGKRVEQEIRRHFSGSEEGSMESIRIVNMGGQGVEPWGLMPLMNKELRIYYEKLAKCESVHCHGTGKTFDGICKPSATIVDFFVLEGLYIIRSVSNKKVPVYAWSSGNAAATLRFLGPEKLGGVGDVPMKARAQAEVTGRKVEDIIHELYFPTSGDLVNLPGLPAMYDYEFSPQEISPEISQSEILSIAYKFGQECDGFVASTSTAYEPESVEATRKWLEETKRPLFTIGPLLPPGAGKAGLSDTAKEKDRSDFLPFLDKVLKTHGIKSLIYISFGSFWWPKSEYLLVFVDALLELNIPFILSHPSPKATFPPGLAEKVKSCGIGVMSAWSPQQTILNHPATGWILTHAGQNSVIEALTLGIPMIVWPISADQPANAAYVTLTLDVAFEMIEVRTGRPGLMPLRRGVTPAGTLAAVKEEARSILQKVGGPEGERKRRHAEILRDKFRGEWEEGGDALRDLRRLLNSVSSSS